MIDKQMAILDAKLDVGRIEPDIYKAAVNGLKKKRTHVEARQEQVDPEWIKKAKSIQHYIDDYESMITALKSGEMFPKEGISVRVQEHIFRTHRNVNYLMGQYNLVAVMHTDNTISLRGNIPLPQAEFGLSEPLTQSENGLP